MWFLSFPKAVESLIVTRGSSLASMIRLTLAESNPELDRAHVLLADALVVWKVAIETDKLPQVFAVIPVPVVLALDFFRQSVVIGEECPLAAGAVSIARVEGGDFEGVGQ